MSSLTYCKSLKRLICNIIDRLVIAIYMICFLSLDFILCQPIRKYLQCVYRLKGCGMGAAAMLPVTRALHHCTKLEELL